MTEAALAARNYLAQQTSVTALLGSDTLWGAWVFYRTPEVNIEGTGKAMVVINATDGWGSPNDHNTSRFPRLTIDIWVDPTRNTDRSVRQADAQLRAEAIYKAIDKHFHIIQASAEGKSIFWGDANQITNSTGLRVLGSKRSGEPTYSPAINDEGAVIATVRYDLKL